MSLRSIVDECAAEHVRQFTDEGYSTDRDDGYVWDELAMAAATYATAPRLRKLIYRSDGGETPSTWPWDSESWKPKDRRRELIVAVALLFAELRRLDRASDHDTD